MPFTLGFKARWLLNEHFENHAREFKDFVITDEVHYQSLADAFLGGPLGSTVIECHRTQFDQALVRYNYATQEIGVLDVNNYILTYFKPDPSEHGHSTNRAYFEWQKNRRR